MRKSKKFTKKLALIVILFFFIHFILQFGFLILGFSVGMAHFDNPDNAELGIKSERYMNVYTVLSFPVLFIMDRMVPADFFPGLTGYIPFILNSALWSLAFYFLVRNNFILDKS